MPTKRPTKRGVPNAKQTKAYRFYLQDIVALKSSPQVTRYRPLDLAHVAWLCGQMLENGQLTPGVIRLVNGEAELVTGRHRQAAVIKLNKDHPDKAIPFEVVCRNLTDEEVILATIADNAGMPPTCMDLAAGAQRLKDKGWPVKKIAHHIQSSTVKCSAGRVGQLIKLLDLPTAIQEKVHVGAMPESVARKLLTLGYSSDEMEKVSAQLETGELKSVDITHKANAAMRAVGKKIKRTRNDLLELLESVGTEPSMLVRGWLNGQDVKAKKLAKIFKGPKYVAPPVEKKRVARTAHTYEAQMASIRKEMSALGLSEQEIDKRIADIMSKAVIAKRGGGRTATALDKGAVSAGEEMFDGDV